MDPCLPPKNPACSARFSVDSDSLVYPSLGRFCFDVDSLSGKSPADFKKSPVVLKLLGVLTNLLTRCKVESGGSSLQRLRLSTPHEQFLNCPGILLHRERHDVLKEVLLTALTPLFSSGAPAFHELQILGFLGKCFHLCLEHPWERHPLQCHVYGSSLRALVLSCRGPWGRGFDWLSLADQLLRFFPPANFSSLEELHLRPSEVLDLLRDHLPQVNVFISPFLGGVGQLVV